MHSPRSSVPGSRRRAAATPRSRRAPHSSSRASAARRAARAPPRRTAPGRRGSAAPAGRRGRAPPRRDGRARASGDADERVAGRRHLAEPRPDDEQQVGVADARGELRVDADADVADVARRVVVDRVLPPERRAGGELVRLDERAHVDRAPAASSPRRRAGRTVAPRPSSSVAQAVDRRPRRDAAARRGTARRRRRRSPSTSMSSGSASTTGPGRPAQAVVNARCDVLRDPVGAVDLRDPLRHRAEHPPVVDLLEGLALLLVGGDLADEQDQRRRVLERGVHADRRVRRAGAARDDRDARPAGELPVGVGHVRGARPRGGT